MRNKLYGKFALTLLLAAIVFVIRLINHPILSEPLAYACTAAFIVLTILLTSRECNNYNTPGNVQLIFNTSNNDTFRGAILTIAILLIPVMTLSGVFTIFDINTYNRRGVETFLEIILAAFQLMAAVSFLLIIKTSFHPYDEDNSQNVLRTAGVLLLLFSCYSVMLIYRHNAGNPYLFEYSWEMVSFSAFAFMWLYIMGISAGKNYTHFKAMRIMPRVAIITSAAALVRVVNLSSLFRIIFFFVSSIIIEILFCRNLTSSDKPSVISVIFDETDSKNQIEE